MLFFAETFQPMNAALTFQIGLNDLARAIRGKFTLAAYKCDWSMTRGELITQYNTTCHFFFISILIMTKSMRFIWWKKNAHNAILQ